MEKKARMNNACLLLLLSVVCRCEGDPCAGIGNTRLYSQDSCYVYFNVASAKTIASNTCHSHGIHLVFLETHVEQAWLETELANRQLYNTFWTGGELVSSTWVWRDSVLEVTYGDVDPWRLTDPNTLSPHLMCNPGSIMLTPRQYYEYHNYICESGVPTTATTTTNVALSTAPMTTAMTTEQVQSDTTTSFQGGSYEAILGIFEERTFQRIFDILSCIQVLRTVSFTTDIYCTVQCAMTPTCEMAVMDFVLQSCILIGEDRSCPGSILECNAPHRNCFNLN